MDYQAQDADRLEALHAYHILDTPPDELFDLLTEIASKTLNMPISLVSLIDEKRQWFKSRVGLDATETPREVAFCDHAIRDKVPFVVPDALADSRFANNPLVTGAPEVRFYAGIPIHSPDGHGLGTLCVIDHEPRQLTESQLEMLSGLAGLAGSALELHRKTNILERSVDEMKVRHSRNELLASMMVHDMRGPLSAIIGLASIEVMDAQGSMAESFKDITLSAQRINRMAMDVLDICIAGTGSLTLRPAKVDLGEIISEQVRLLGPVAKSLGVGIDWQPGAPRIVTLDPELIARVITNLLDNGLRHAPESTQVTIDLEVSADSTSVSIRDLGPGIPEDQLERIFDPLARAATTEERGSHYGLGLAFCRLAVEVHGGTIRAEPLPGKGARLFFTLGEQDA